MSHRTHSKFSSSSHRGLLLLFCARVSNQFPTHKLSVFIRRRLIIHHSRHATWCHGFVYGPLPIPFPQICPKALYHNIHVGVLLSSSPFCDMGLPHILLWRGEVTTSAQSHSTSCFLCHVYGDLLSWDFFKILQNIHSNSISVLWFTSQCCQDFESYLQEA